MNNAFIETVNARKQTQKEVGTQPVRLHKGLHEMLLRTEPEKNITSQVNALIIREVTKRWNLTAEERSQPVFTEAEMYSYATKVVIEKDKQRNEGTNDPANQSV